MGWIDRISRAGAIAKAAKPEGARYLSPGDIAATGGSNQIKDLSNQFWFSALSPVQPMAPTGMKVRAYDFQPGSNLVWTPGSETYGSSPFPVLREMADSWDLQI